MRGILLATLILQTGNQAFISVGGNVTFFTVPGAVTLSVYGLNNLNQCVGAYFDSGSVYHGFFRNAGGTLTYPIDPGRFHANVYLREQR
jgi:hypothetical protein